MTPVPAVVQTSPTRAVHTTLRVMT
jgi:hypothetical protein